MLTRGHWDVSPPGTRIDEGALIVFPDDAKWITCTAKTHKAAPQGGPEWGGGAVLCTSFPSSDAKRLKEKLPGRLPSLYWISVRHFQTSCFHEVGSKSKIFVCAKTQQVVSGV